MTAGSRHLSVGRAGEDAAASFLLSLGWRVLDRNWRPRGTDRGLELDIVALEGNGLVFVEVKTRSRRGGGIPAYAAFTGQKRARIARAAGYYLSARDMWNIPCRFDLILVEGGAGGQLMLEHHKNVIELGHLVDSSHASWQPW